MNNETGRSESAVGRLVCDADSFTRAWESTPLLSRGLDTFDDIVSPAMLQDAIQNRGLRTPFISMIRNGGRLDERVYTYAAESGPGQIAALVDPVKVRDRLTEGATLVAQGLRWYFPSVRDFCATLSSELGHYISANIYLTPPQSRGGGVHYDFHSVFIKQVRGTKSWCVRAPSEPLPAEPCSVGDRVLTPVVLEARLEPGDCLYLPRGYIHDGWTSDSWSLHVTCGLKDPVTWADIIAKELCDRALKESLELRAIPPPRFADVPVELRDEVESRLAAFKNVLSETKPDDIIAAAIQRLGPDTWPRQSPPDFSILDGLE
jgi:hypothetical protein